VDDDLLFEEGNKNEMDGKIQKKTVKKKMKPINGLQNCRLIFPEAKKNCLNQY